MYSFSVYLSEKVSTLTMSFGLINAICSSLTVICIMIFLNLFRFL